MLMGEQMELKKSDPPVCLSTGRVALHRRASNNSQDVYFVDEPQEMTEQEWNEYVAIIRDRASRNQKGR